ncbi:hypothetical protein AB595_06150 [Massilia sp. WF1]|nr:hypothetical protein AB595_06150 [Massilia sp. WF1]
MPSISDDELAAEFRKTLSGGSEILFVANKFKVAMFARAAATSSWSAVAAGEFDEECINAVSSNVRTRRVFWDSTTLAEPQFVDLSTAAPALVKKALIASWAKTADQVTGRLGHVSSDVKREVAYLAAYHCQFPGCGTDLGQHAATGGKGTFSYFAHIVAASADGPRGDLLESPRLVNDPSNFLLLCDECHRLIDKVDPKKYTVEQLRQMRTESIREVKRLLGTLRYPEVDVVYFLGNVTGQVAHISDRDMDEALWASGLRRSSKNPESYFEFGRQHHAPHKLSYWSAVFATLKFDVPNLQAKLNGVRTGGVPRPRLAVFPFHGTSVMLLAGRLLGDMAGTYVFQPHRNKMSEPSGTRWAWPTDAVVPTQEKFEVKTLKGHTGSEDEANLIVSLTFPVAAARLAPVSAENGNLILPTIEISVENFGHSTIRHPSDLTLFGAAVDQALRCVQDVWNIKKVHLYVGAPAAAVVLVGQKMQARHHATFVCYEALPGNGPFAPTIEISSQTVRTVGQDLSVSLQT